MLLTPNKLNWATCPLCKVILNCWDNVPIEALGDPFWHFMKCPACKGEVLTRVRVTFDIQIEPIGEINGSV